VQVNADGDRVHRLNNNFVWRKRFNFAIPHKNTSNRIVTHLTVLLTVRFLTVKRIC